MHFVGDITASVGDGPNIGTPIGKFVLGDVTYNLHATPIPTFNNKDGVMCIPAWLIPSSPNPEKATLSFRHEEIEMVIPSKTLAMEDDLTVIIKVWLMVPKVECYNTGILVLKRPRFPWEVSLSR